METIAKQLVKPTLTQQRVSEWHFSHNLTFVQIAYWAHGGCLNMVDYAFCAMFPPLPVKLLLAPGTPGTHSVTQYKSPL